MFPNNINTLNNMRNPSHFGISALNSGQNNFSQAFQQFPQLIPQRPTENHGNLAHNNVNQNILSEIVTEYTINVDSADRDTTLYPSPYRFTISLGGSGDYKGYVGVPAPRIDMNFKNVKYIKLKYLMMPKTMLYYTDSYDSTLKNANGTRLRTVNYYDPYHLDIITQNGFVTFFGQKEQGGNNENFENVESILPNINQGDILTYTKTKSHILANYRYLMLRIKEIDNDKVLTSDTIKRDNCFILYRDSNYHDAKNDLWIATQPTKIFYDDNLKNLNKLTLEILKPDGKLFGLMYYGNFRNGQGEGVRGVWTVSIDAPLEIDEKHYADTANVYLNPATLPVQNTNTTGGLFDASNINLEFEIGVCENQLNTEKQYR